MKSVSSGLFWFGDEHAIPGGRIRSDIIHVAIRHAPVNSTEDMGLVYVEHSFGVERSVRTPDG
jgi:hypothetical protein